MTSSSDNGAAGRFFGSFMRAGLLGMVGLLLGLSACSSKSADSNATTSEGAGGADAGVAVVTAWPHSFLAGGAGGGLPTGASPRAHALTPEAVAPHRNPTEESVRAFIASHPPHAFPAGAAIPPATSKAAEGDAAPPAPNFAPNTVKDLTTCTSVTLTSDHPTATYDSTGQYVVQGQTIVWTATGVCPGAAQYRFVLLGTDGVWRQLQDWSSSNTLSWDTTGLQTGFLTLQVWVRAGQSGSYDAYTGKGILLNNAAQCTGVTVTSDHPYRWLNYAVKGDTVRWSAASTCGGQPRYKFWLLGPGATSYVVARDWSTSPIFDWNTAGLTSGYWGLIVYVSNVPFYESYYEAYTSVTAIVNDYASCTSASVTSDDADYYAVPGQQVHWTATSTCGGPAEYRWVFDDPSGVWHELQAWSPSNTLTWDTTNQPLGFWNVQAWVRDAPFFDDEQAFGSGYFVLNSSQPCLGITSTPTPSVVVAGTPVAVHSSVTNCTTSEYQVWHLPPGGSWQAISQYSPANANYVWDSTGAAVGTHTFEVLTRTQGAVQQYQTYSSFYVSVIAGTGISTDTATVQDFNTLGTAGVAALPSGWRIDKQANPNTVGNYSAAPPLTELSFGASAAAPSTNGIYNFGAGVANAQASNYWLNSTDRAPGWFSDGSTLTTGGTKSGNLYVALKAPPDKDLSGLDIGYDVKKFSAGTNPSGFRVQLFSSTDGQSWTSAGSAFQTAFVHDASNAGFDPAPGATSPVPISRLNLPIARSAPVYLAWNYTVNSSSSVDGSNAQALGIDNVSIKGALQCLPNCASKHCGDDPADGCGHTCTIVCQDGEAGCINDASCNPGSLCSGKAPSSTTPNICQPQVCSTNPRLGGCGYAGAPCGATCTSNPTCSTAQDCPSGYVCGSNNGYRYGVPGANVCEKPSCQTDPVGSGCGSITSECGACTCTPNCSTKHCGDADLSDGCGGTCLSLCNNHAQCTGNSDCQAGSVCVAGAGGRVGLAAGTSACLPVGCTSATLAAPDCGTTASMCGTCPTQSANCGARVCGVDPSTGMQCGSACPTGQFCSATGQCATFDPTTPIVVHDLNGGAVPLTAPTAPEAASVGTTRGEFSVSDRGSATYVVPVQVAPGRAGIEPNVSVRYSSSTGNGALGVGWSLDGLSTIDRCQRTFAQDGYTQPVTVTPADALCLDGQRLVPTGTDEYRTEVDTFSKILVHRM